MLMPSFLCFVFSLRPPFHRMMPPTCRVGPPTSFNVSQRWATYVTEYHIKLTIIIKISGQAALAMGSKSLSLIRELPFGSAWRSSQCGTQFPQSKRSKRKEGKHLEVLSHNLRCHARSLPSQFPRSCLSRARGDHPTAWNPLSEGHRGHLPPWLVTVRSFLSCLDSSRLGSI